MTSNWWHTPNTPAPSRSDINEWIYQWALQALTLKALKEGGPPPLRVGALGPVSDPDVYLKLVALLDAHKAVVAEESLYVWDDDFEEVRAWDTGAAFIATTDNGTRLGVNAVTTDPEFLEEIRAFLHTNILKKAPTHQGKVYVLTQGPDGISPSSLGFAAVPLELDNYEPSIQPLISQAVLDLATQWPDGRLTILEGPPGCGKTFLIRSLVHAVPKAKFIFVPPALVPSLGDPSLASALLSLRDHDDSEDRVYHGPTILICEDADSILVTRAIDNMPAISSVLNLTSGLLGDVIDMRVIATTNAPRTKIEPALLRNGRLAHYIQVAPLSQSQASSVLDRLLGEKQVVDSWPHAQVPKHSGGMGFSTDSVQELPDKVLLADVFKEAKKRGWRPDRGSRTSDLHKVVVRRPRSYAVSSTKVTS